MPVVAGNRRLIAATVDHGLQTGSAERARDVAELLRDNGFDRVEILTVVVDGAGGPEAAARDARYRALSGLVEDIGSGAGTCARRAVGAHRRGPG